MATVKDRNAKKEWAQRVKLLRSQTVVNFNESKSDKQARIDKARLDYEFFVSHYLPNFATTKTPAFHTKAAKRIKKNKELAIWLKWGRGLAKSVVADVTIPLWLWINNDIEFMLLIGQNEDKASILLDDLKLQFEGNDRLIHDFGDQRNSGHWENGFFITKNGFIAKSMGMGQDPRGLRVGGSRPDYIACDDWETKETIKNQKRQREYAKWLLSGVIPTMDGARQRVVLAQNGFAPEMIFNLIVDNNKGWKVQSQNAFDPETLEPVWKEKYDKDYYHKRIEIMGSLEANAEYNNDPHVEGKVFTDEMIQWDKSPRLDSFVAIVGTWDVAYAGSKTSDFNAIKVWGLTKDGRKIQLDCLVKRCKIRVALEWIADYQKNLPASVSVPFRFEAQFWNDEIYRVINETEKKFDIKLNLVKSERSRKKKYDRMLEMLPQYQNGRIYYSQKLKNHNDTKEGIAQLKGLEPGYKGPDDSPDADKEAFDYLDRFTRSSQHTYRIGLRESRKY
jgi:phage terminase large subunit-like protein